jgi:hypothetical protein
VEIPQGILFYRYYSYLCYNIVHCFALLIQKGGGTGPKKPWQPTSVRCQILFAFAKKISAFKFPYKYLNIIGKVNGY